LAGAKLVPYVFAVALSARPYTLIRCLAP
jgi:hypothetical protein